MRGFQPMARQIKTGPINKPTNGGAVRGLHGFAPGAMAQVLNQQPDSIPAMMKPGEYVLPPDTVAAMGGPQALDATVAQTHTPSNAGAIVPRGFEPKHFFANGGLVEDEQPQQAPTATPTPAPDAAPGGQPAASRGFSPAAPATPSPAPAQTPRAQFVADQNQKLAAANTQLAERTAQLNERYKPSPNSPTNTFPGNRMLGAASSAPTVGFQPGQLNQPTTAAPQPNQPSAQGMQATNALAGQTSPQIPGEVLSTKPAPQAAPAAPQVRGLPGVYQHGKGQYSDNPEGMGFAPGRTGQPSTQNMQAADALASQQQAQSTARVQAAAQQQAVPQTRGFPGFEMPRQESAYEREARQRERNRIMGMLQTPMTGDPRRDLTASQRQQLVAQLGQESQERQATERNMFGLAGQHLNAETQRYSTDANAALGVERNSIDQQRVGLDGQRLANEQRQQAITNDLAERRLALDDRKAGTANIPSGYRAAADGQGLEAIPGGPADPRTSKAALQRREDAGYVTDILDMARPLVEKSTGSYLGAAVDKAAQVVGQSTDGGNAAAQLKVLQGALVSKMPRMEGPQSDKDVQLYREMAAQIGDSTVPRQQRMEAMNTLEMLQQKYAPAQQAQDGQGEQQRRVMRTGVYNGRRVVQYEDGSLSYAD